MRVRAYLRAGVRVKLSKQACVQSYDLYETVRPLFAIEASPGVSKCVLFLGY